MNRKIFLTAQSVLLVLLVLLMSVSVMGIYRDGVARKAEKPLEWIYTREQAGESFARIAPLFWLSVGITAAGIVLGIQDESADRMVQDVRISRDLMAAKVAVASEAMSRERARQRNLSIAGWAGFAFCMVPILLYVCAGDHFPDGDLERMFRSLLFAAVPWTMAGLACLTASMVLQEQSMQRELDAAKIQHSLEKTAGVDLMTLPGKAEDGKHVRQVRIAILCAALALIALGILNGGARDVLYKAAKICTECVGLG